ncbi:type VII secretion target [Microbacterium sp. NPDC090007]|uniref:type VII secretion target n=1 Tax=Microbacterium sp. NPDC090007 TaxID=3364204 RepID=UPI003830FB27
MADDITVDFEALRHHAAFVDALVGDVETALSALRGGDLLPDAFGVLCSFLVAPSVALSAAATGLLGEDASLLVRTAGELRRTADQWERFEDDAVATIRSLEAAMDAR